MPELAYRYEDVRYAGPEDNPHGGDLKVELRTYHVVRHTPKGYWVADGDPGLSLLQLPHRFVRQQAKKKFACLTKVEALRSFRARKLRQAELLRARLHDAEEAVCLANDLAFAHRLETYRFWLSGWERAAKAREGNPHLQATAEYLDRRWQAMNVRLGRWAESHPSSLFTSSTDAPRI